MNSNTGETGYWGEAQPLRPSTDPLSPNLHCNTMPRLLQKHYAGTQVLGGGVFGELLPPALVLVAAPASCASGKEQDHHPGRASFQQEPIGEMGPFT